MSRFFRRSEDSSSSSGSDSTNESDGEEDPPADDVQSTSELSPNVNNTSPSDGSLEHQPAAWTNSHERFLLHALLEERSMTEVLASYQNRSLRQPRRDSPEVQALANARYQGLCAQLASYNLISSGLEADQYATTRQRYRDGLNLLRQTSSSNTAPAALRRLLLANTTNSNGNTERHATSSLANYPLRDIGDLLRRPPLPMAVAGLSGARLTEVPSWAGANGPYLEQFEEINTLGHGGYGIVYHVRHRVDNHVYAVKKIPLSNSRLVRIKHTGELDELLREVRTLARLEHPNIVRYHTAWIEWVDNQKLSPATRHHKLALPEPDDAAPGAEDSTMSIERVVTESDGDEILFEGSDAKYDQSVHARGDTGETSQLYRVRTQSSNDTSDSAFDNDDPGESTDPLVALSDTNEISAANNQSTSIQSGVHGAHFKEPTYALHLQMSFHPMTLQEFLMPPSESETTTTPLAHCFHVQTAVSLLFAILDGIEYLHGHGIVHRDIKPANIFIGPIETVWATKSSVDLNLCTDCHAAGNATPVKLEVRIGDFGLVTVAGAETHSSPDSNSKAVGTHLYRPLSSEPTSPSLDIYALGIVAFELVWKFSTAWERIETIKKLKNGHFPAGFSTKVCRKRGEKVQVCIQAMLSHSESGMSIQELKQMLSAIL